VVWYATMYKRLANAVLVVPDLTLRDAMSSPDFEVPSVALAHDWNVHGRPTW
jgi:hypothetical protein